MNKKFTLQVLIVLLVIVASLDLSGAIRSTFGTILEVIIVVVGSIVYYAPSR